MGLKKGKSLEFDEGGSSKHSSKLCGTNYPLSIAFIVVNEFCERFSYNGMKAVLTLYFMHYLHWDEDQSTAVYHAFYSLCYFTPVLGALIADCWLGKFKTIIYLSILYAIGHVIKSLGAIPHVGDPTMHIVLSMLGLGLIALGTGGIKPCVAAFGGDQFEAEHTEERRKFFSIFYMSINAGGVLSTLITPILRADVQCFGGDCYALAFGVPAVLMVIALAVFIAGSSLYKKTPPEGNILLEVCRCIGFAIKNRWRNRGTGPKRAHWLDWAEDKYSVNKHDNQKHRIHEIKNVLRVLRLYIPLPMFWALYDQQGSRWTLQATRTNMAFGSFILKPDQLQMLNSLLILLFIPIFDFGVYPLIELCRIRFTPLKKMTTGMVLAALAFVAATLVEMEVTKTVVEPPLEGQSLVKVLNLAGRDIQVTIPGSGLFPHPIVSYGNEQEYEKLQLNGKNQTLTATIVHNGTNTSCVLDFNELTAYSLILVNEPFSIQCKLEEDQIMRSKSGDAYVRFVNAYEEHLNITVGGKNFPALKEYGVTPYDTVERGVYTDVKCTDGQVEHTLNLGLLDFGASYTITLQSGPEEIVAYKTEDVRANDVHIAWLIPQYALLTAGEVTFSITGLEFSYSQAPESMKSLLLAGWLLTIAFGNVIVLIVAEGAGLQQWVEFLLFAGLLVAVSIIFAIMAHFYSYVDSDQLGKMSWDENRDEDSDVLKRDPTENTNLTTECKSTKM